jgi:hypothetical protein
MDPDEVLSEQAYTMDLDLFGDPPSVHIVTLDIKLVRRIQLIVTQRIKERNSKIPSKRFENALVNVDVHVYDPHLFLLGLWDIPDNHLADSGSINFVDLNYYDQGEIRSDGGVSPYNRIPSHISAWDR